MEVTPPPPSPQTPLQTTKNQKKNTGGPGLFFALTLSWNLPFPRGEESRDSFSPPEMDSPPPESFNVFSFARRNPERADSSQPVLLPPETVPFFFLGGIPSEVSVELRFFPFRLPSPRIPRGPRVFFFCERQFRRGSGLSVFVPASPSRRDAFSEAQPHFKFLII